jgi:DNA-binding CsgD family transcriptional regulator
MQGVDLAAAASSMRIQMATVRTHLRGLLTKTQTHRQADLVRVLLQEIGPMV